MRINTNISALVAQGNLSKVEKNVQKSMEKLSSGFRINQASDDAAGLGISNKLRNDIRSLQQANRNAEQANSMLQVAEGATSTIANVLDRMKELAAQSASSNSGNRTTLQDEFNTLRTEIDRIVTTTSYQGTKLINGTMGTYYDAAAGGTTLDTNTMIQASTIKAAGAAASTYTLAKVDGTHLKLTDTAGNVEVKTVVGAGVENVNFARFGISFTTDATFTLAGALAAGSDVVVATGANAGQFLVSSSGDYANTDLVNLSVAINLGSTALGIGASDLSSQGGAQTALAAIDTAVGNVNSALATIGATQNRIGFATDSVKATLQNYTAAESTIRDVDMAEEMTRFSKNQILSQAGTAMLAQANQAGQGVLQLLRG
jgi:flagellin